jgi:hypothetical protein
VQLEKKRRKERGQKSESSVFSSNKQSRADFMAFSQLLSMPIGGAQHGRRRLTMEVE